MAGTRFIEDESVRIYLLDGYKEFLSGRLVSGVMGTFRIDGDVLLQHDVSGRVYFETDDPVGMPIPPTILQLMQDGKVAGVSVMVTFTDPIEEIRPGVWYQAPTGRLRINPSNLYKRKVHILSDSLEGANAIVEALRLGTPSFVTL